MSATAVVEKVAVSTAQSLQKTPARKLIEKEILAALGECENCCFVSPSASITQMRSGLTATPCSNAMFKRALGSLIHRGKVVWSRPPRQHIDDDERPITLKLPVPVVQASTSKQCGYRPYFA